MTIIALSSASLSGCSTNTNDQNTAIGAGTGAVLGGAAGSLARGAGSGWVIAAGAVVGALIGGLIGHNMDSSDQIHANAAMNNNAMNTSSSWKNVENNTTYKVVPTSNYFTWRGNPNCRHYVAYGTYNGHTTKTYGVACRLEDGTWRKVK